MKSENKKKIIFILHLPPPIHGSAVVGHHILNSLIINNTFGSRFINLSTSKNLNEIGNVSLIKFIILFKLVLHVIKEIFIFKPDLFYMTPTAKGSGFYKDFLIILLMKVTGRKILYHFHNKGVATRHHLFLDNLLYKIAFNNNYCILLSPLLYSDIQKYIPWERTFFCANGIPDISYKNILRERNVICQLLFLSNMMEEKGINVLIEACSLLKQRKHQFRCHFVGKWFDITEETFNTKVRELNLDNIVLAYGGQYGKEKEEFFSMADIFVLPTNNDCFPLVLLEAMQHSLPIISTIEGGIPDIIEDGITGYLANRKDAKDLADKIELLLNNPSLRQKMGLAGKEKFLNNYTLSKWENNMFNILTEVTNK